MKERATNEFDGIKISQIANSLYNKQYLFALDSEQNLMAIDVSLLCKGVKPYQIVKFDRYCSKILTLGKQNL